MGVNGEWAGYYRGKLFSAGHADSSSTLQAKANKLAWYGEIAQNEDALTTTNTGSGRFASEGYGYAAYIHNILVAPENGHEPVDYSGSGKATVSDSSRYSLVTNFLSGASCGSYLYLEGPGA